MDAAVALFTIVGAVANIVMATAAVAALSLWRKQVAGASHHELAKKLAALFRQLTSNRADVLMSLRLLNDYPQAKAQEYLTTKYLNPTAGRLDASVQELIGLEGQIDVQWGHAIYNLVETIRSESARLATHAGLFNREEAEASEIDVFRQLVAKPRDVAPNYVGTTYERALKLLTGLAQEFLAGYLGRDGAKPISAEELVARRKRVDAEIAQLAETETATIARKEAEQQKQTTEGA